MAITLEANYSKKLGLPNYSSHQFSVSVKTELNDLSKIEAQCNKLYATLQHSVDQEIQHAGFLPGQTETIVSQNTNGSSGNTNGNEKWKCSEKQRHLLIDLVTQQNIEKEAISVLAMNRFSKDVKSLNKMEMSGLLGELLENCKQSTARQVTVAQRRPVNGR